MALPESEIYSIVVLALLVITFVPSVILLLASLCVARRRKDGVRNWLLYMKFAFMNYCLSLFLYAVSYAVSVAVWETDLYILSSDGYISLIEAQVYTSAIGRLFASWAEILVFLALVSLGSGCVVAGNGPHEGFHSIAKFTAYGMAAILGILSIVVFGLTIAFDVDYYGDHFFTGAVSDGGFDLVTSSIQIDFAFCVLMLVCCVGVLARSVFIKVQERPEVGAGVQKASIFLLVCGALWLIRTAFDIANLATQYNLNNILDSPTYQLYLSVLDVVLSEWPTFIILCLLFSLGCMKRSGLWSTEQPFMAHHSGPVMGVTPSGYQQYGYQQPQLQSWQPQEYQQQYQQPPHQQYQGYPPQQGYYGPQQQQRQSQQFQTTSRGFQAPQSPQSQSQSQSQSGYDSRISSPPPGDQAMGYGHQADGMAPGQSHEQPRG